MSQAASWGVPSVGPSTAIQYSVRANASLDAVLSSHSGSSAPSYAVQGTMWMDTTNSPQMDLRIRDQSSNNVKWGHTLGGEFYPFLTTNALNALRNALIPVGFGPVAWWLASDPAPSGFIYAYGQQITSTYPVLRAALIAAGNPYGSSGGNPLCIDMRGRAPWGKDDQGGTAAGRVSTAGGGVDGLTLGATGGAQNRTISQGNLPSVNLTGGTLAVGTAITFSLSVGTAITPNPHSHSYTKPQNDHNTSTAGGQATSDAGTTATTATTSLALASGTVAGTATLTSGTVTGNLPLGGSGTALITMPPVIVVYYVIKAH